MKQLAHYEIHRVEINNRVLLDEAIKASDENRQKREFYEKNKLLNIK